VKSQFLGILILLLMHTFLGCKSKSDSVDLSSASSGSGTTVTNLFPVKTPSLAFKIPAQSPGNSATPTLTVLDVTAGYTAKIYSDSSCLAGLGTSGVATGTSVDVVVTTALSPGLNTIYAKAFDDKGSSSSCSYVSLLYLLDVTVLPITSLVLVSPATDFEISPSPVIRVSPVEVGATINLYSDAICSTLIGSKVATATSEDVTLLLATPANYTIYAKQVDPAGNISTCSTATVRYTYAKSFNVTSTTAATNVDASINGICADAGAKCSLRAAFDEMAADSTTPYLFNLEAGTYTVNTGFTKAFSFVKLRGVSETTSIIQGNNTSYFFASSGLAYGINLENVQIDNFSGSTGSDIFLNPILSQRKYFFKNVQFKGNSIGAGADGIISSYAQGTTLENVLFEANTGTWATFYQWSGKANLKNVYFKNNTTSWALRLRVCDAEIENISINGSGGHGIFLSDPLNINAKNITVTNVPNNGIHIDAGVFTSLVNFYNATVYGNGVTSGSSLYAFSASNNPMILNFYNSILAIDGIKPNCNIQTSGGGLPSVITFNSSLFDEASCGAGAGNLVGVSPQLNALTTPSAYVAVLVPQITSPAIDAGSNATCAATDQTGQARPINKLGGGAICDMGAVEVP
jgi:hypothetical protein